MKEIVGLLKKLCQEKNLILNKNKYFYFNFSKTTKVSFKKRLKIILLKITLLES